MLHPNDRYCINHPNRKKFSHDRCLYCYRKEILYPKSLLKPKKIYKIKNVSDKRVILNKEYSRIKEEKWKELIVNKQNKCFFSDITLDPKGPIPDFHHLFGRQDDLLCDRRYMFPVLFKPHRQYTDISYEYRYLEKIDWYFTWLNRIKTELPMLYQKEMFKIERANKQINKFNI